MEILIPLEIIVCEYLAQYAFLGKKFQAKKSCSSLYLLSISTHHILA